MPVGRFWGKPTRLIYGFLFDYVFERNKGGVRLLFDFFFYKLTDGQQQQQQQQSNVIFPAERFLFARIFSFSSWFSYFNSNLWTPPPSQLLFFCPVKGKECAVYPRTALVTHLTNQFSLFSSLPFACSACWRDGFDSFKRF